MSYEDKKQKLLRNSGSEAISTRDGGEVLEVSEVPNNEELTFITRTNQEKNIFKNKNITQKITAHKSKGLQFDDVLLQKNSFLNKDIHPENRLFLILNK